jgi:hypothetical protein
MAIPKITGLVVSKSRHLLGYGPWKLGVSGIVEVTNRNDAIVEFAVAGLNLPVLMQLRGFLFSTAFYKEMAPHSHTFSHTHAAVGGVTTNNLQDHSHSFATQNLSGHINFTTGGSDNPLATSSDGSHDHNLDLAFGAQSNSTSSTAGRGTGTFPSVGDTASLYTYFGNLSMFIFNHTSSLYEDVSASAKTLSGVPTWGGSGTFATTGTGAFDISSLLNVNRIGTNNIVRVKFTEPTATGGRLQYTMG